VGKGPAVGARTLGGYDREGTLLDRKRLESIRGFLLYLTRTYPNMTPHLKGLHLSIDGWRPDRDEAGWKLPSKGRMSEARVKSTLLEQDEDGEWVERVLDKPNKVHAASRFRDDAFAMKAFFERAGFADASGEGFGGSFSTDGGKRGLKRGNSTVVEGHKLVEGDEVAADVDEHVYYRFGQWCAEDSEESSNYRELKNLVDSLRRFATDRDLRGVEIFLFTDNSTAEAAFWKGNSSSRKLFELVLELKRLEYDLGLILHVIHVSGTRMMAQGTDGLSRADFSEGVMAGKAMTSFVPLHLSCEERCPGIEDWLLGVLPSSGGGSGTHLSESDWFMAGHTPGAWLWTPAPASAEVVVEQLGKARHKRPHVLHMVAVPRLMTGRWRRHLTRESDFYFRVPVGCPLWPAAMFEPLLIFVCLPFVSHRPWLHGHRNALETLVGKLCEPDVWKTDHHEAGALLREFLLRSWSLSSMP
jgi:hypothetical protein